MSALPLASIFRVVQKLCKIVRVKENLYSFIVPEISSELCKYI